MEICWIDFKCFNVKFYVSALVGVIIKVILRNARCNNKDTLLYVSAGVAACHRYGVCTVRCVECD